MAINNEIYLNSETKLNFEVLEMKKLEDGKNGQVVIPPEIVAKFGLKTGEKVFVRKKYQYIILEKPKKMFGDKILKLLKHGLRDVTWKDIEKEREDRTC
ncbi:MAG: hypothetical protein B6D64_10345 [Bacteroidetes bacterium 4484_276]|nr:MAG: hypothetical protein B6D64_10345 [Bacteroidetes bacterium 4484_276]